MLKTIPRRAANRLKALRRQYHTRKMQAFSESLKKSEPVVVLGNQKTGSTAIAALLAQATGKSVTLDLQRAIPDVGWQLCVKYGVTPFREIAHKYKDDFSMPIIKEPSLSYFYDEMLELMPNAKYVFIQRNPYQNIRSVLNRLKIPGDLTDIEYDQWPELCKTPVWRLALDSSWLGRPKGSYIESMAHRWDIAARTYLDSPECFILIRYEDFVKDKKSSIEGLASDLGLVVQEDIGTNVDVQYQGKGNRSASPGEFFGETNREVIRKICGESAKKLGYEL